jgi:riboflavin synthase
MFNGIVETIALINSIQDINGCREIVLTPHLDFNDLNTNDSLSVNGVCLTITTIINNQITVTVVPETLRVTNLKWLAAGSKVNVERSLLPHTRIDGHYVQGHVDGLGEIKSIKKDGDALLLTVGIDSNLAKYIVNKAYICIDGMSITVINCESEYFTVTLIPHTQKITIIDTYQVGTFVNIEVDILSKYIEKILEARLV